MKNPDKAQETEPKKQTSNYLKGFVEKIKFAIPVYNLVYGVKAISTERQMNKDVQELSKNYTPKKETVDTKAAEPKFEKAA